MDFPYHVSGAASQLFSQNKDSVEHRAISKIAESFEHPQRALVSTFVQHAIDRGVASQFFLDQVSGRDQLALSEFLANWISLAKKIRPVTCTDVKGSLEQNTGKDMEDNAVFPKEESEKQHSRDNLHAYILLSSLLCDSNLFDNGTYQDRSRLLKENCDCKICDRLWAETLFPLNQIIQIE